MKLKSLKCQKEEKIFAEKPINVLLEFHKAFKTKR